MYRRRDRPPLGIGPGTLAGVFDVSSVRARFPSLSREVDGQPVVFADGPGGTQVVDAVIAAMAGFMERGGSNLGGPFATSEETEAVVVGARSAVADLFGAARPVRSSSGRT